MIMMMGYPTQSTVSTPSSLCSVSFLFSKVHNADRAGGLVADVGPTTHAAAAIAGV